eukprot:jgi/Botrbrau1/12113/Bobra.0186s0031.3
MEEVGPSPQSQTAEASVGQGSPRQQRRASPRPRARAPEEARGGWEINLAGQLGHETCFSTCRGRCLWVLPEAAPANAGAVGRGDREDFDQLEALMYRPRELDDGPASADWVVSRQRQCSVTYRTGSPLGRPRGLRWPRLVPLRWVQEQRMLFAEGRLPRARQRYMAILGILWLLSDKVTKMEDEEWEAFFRQLPGADTSMRERWEEPPPGPLRDWLQQQRGLYALGLCPEQLGSRGPSLRSGSGSSRPSASSFGEEANITPSWELHFDLLMDWLPAQGAAGTEGVCGMDGADVGTEGGPRAREAALWVQLQREFQRRNLLLRPAIRRLEALGFQWTPQGGTEEEMRWLAQVGRLLYVVERGKTASAADWQERLQAERRAKVQGRSPPGEPPQAPSFPSTLMAGRRERFLQPPASSPDTLIQKEVRKRMEGWKWAKSEPGLKYWICKQHWLWRRGLLSPERTALLRQAGMSFGYQPSQQWRDSAHLIAFWLTGSFIAKEVMQEAQEEAPSSASGGSAGLSASNLFISEFEGEDMEEVGPSPQSQTAEASVGQGSPRQQRRASRGHELEPQRRHGEVEDIFLRSDAALPWALPDRPAGSGRSGGDARLGNYLAGQLGQRHASPHAEGDSLWVLPEAAPANAGAVGRGDREDFDQLEALMYRPRELDDGPASADWVVSRQRQCSVTYRTGSPLGRPRGLRWPRLVPLRWVQEQRMLFAEGRLPRARQRYMAILGILWLLSDKVTKMEDEEWEAFFRQLPGADTSMRERWEEPPPGPLRDWLQQQRGLYALGLLPDNRFELLREVGVCWEAVRSWQDQEWDDLIALLLQATQIGGEGGIEEGGREPVRLPAHLLYRLHAACTAWRAGHLPASQVAQLQAFGLSPDLALPPSLIAS